MWVGGGQCGEDYVLTSIEHIGSWSFLVISSSKIDVRDKRLRLSVPLRKVSHIMA